MLSRIRRHAGNTSEKVRAKCVFCAGPAENRNAWALEKKDERSGSVVPGPSFQRLVSGDHHNLRGEWESLRQTGSFDFSVSPFIPLSNLFSSFFIPGLFHLLVTGSPSVPCTRPLTSDVTMSVMSRGLSHHIVLLTDICIRNGEILARNSLGISHRGSKCK